MTASFLTAIFMAVFFVVLSLSSMQGTLRGSGRTVPHATPQGGIRSKQTYRLRSATPIRVSARVLISCQAGEDRERWKKWVAVVGMYACWHWRTRSLSERWRVTNLSHNNYFVTYPYCHPYFWRCYTKLTPKPLESRQTLMSMQVTQWVVPLWAWI